ncbi:MAG: DNA polymerase III subunit delta [Gaiellaceae bacterium]
MSAEPLLPVYLLAGTDRPKHGRALARLRARFGAESVESLTADTATGDDAVAACNALGLFAGEGGRLVVVHGVERWRKADVDAVGAYLKQPTPGAVLVLVADETLKSSTLLALCEKHGQVLQFDVPRPANLHAWVRAEFERLGVRADVEAARALVEICGDDVVALASEVDKIVAWAGGEAVTRRDVEQLAVGGREAAAWALTDAWGARDLPALLAACELALERKDPFLLAVGLASHVGRVRAVQALAEEGLRSKEIAARLKMKEFPARKALGHAEKYSRDELDAALVRLAGLDAALKGASRLSAELELQRALVAITRPPERAAAGAGSG